MITYDLVKTAYGFLLVLLMIMPFGVYGTPQTQGILMGYQLPMGYAGLVTGLLTIFHRRLLLLKRVNPGHILLVGGALLVLAVRFTDPDYFINLWHGTSFENWQIDVERYSVGTILTLLIGLVGLAIAMPSLERVGLIALTIGVLLTLLTGLLQTGILQEDYSVSAAGFPFHWYQITFSEGRASGLQLILPGLLIDMAVWAAPSSILVAIAIQARRALSLNRSEHEDRRGMKI